MESDHDRAPAAGWWDGRRAPRAWLVGSCLAALLTATGLLLMLAVPLRINRAAPFAALAARVRANIVVLPDANIAWSASSYAAAFQNVKYPMRLVAARGPSTEIAVFAAAPYNTDSDHVQAGPDPDKTLRVTSDTANMPTIVAIHAPQPTLHGTNRWNTELNWVADECRSGQVVAVGGFNATVDSFGTSALGNCVDAASAQHASSVGTWPTIAPTWLGMPIDHVLATSGWRTQTFTVITDRDQSGARHRPIFAVLTR